MAIELSREDLAVIRTTGVSEAAFIAERERELKEQASRKAKADSGNSGGVAGFVFEGQIHLTTEDEAVLLRAGNISREQFVQERARELEAQKRS